MPVSISGTTGYAGPLGSLTVGTTAIEANAVTPAKMSRTGTSGQVLTSNGAGADPSYQSLPAGGVTSAVAGNGIAVSASTGAVTFSVAAPTQNTVGSYAMVWMTANPSNVGPTATFGGNYSAGTTQGTLQAGTVSQANCGGIAMGYTNSLSGTWKWLGATFNASFYLGYMGIAVRVA
jgi:hypothetical protein